MVQIRTSPACASPRALPSVAVLPAFSVTQIIPGPSVPSLHAELVGVHTLTRIAFEGYPVRRSFVLTGDSRPASVSFYRATDRMILRSETFREQPSSVVVVNILRAFEDEEDSRNLV